MFDRIEERMTLQGAEVQLRLVRLADDVYTGHYCGYATFPEKLAVGGVPDIDAAEDDTYYTDVMGLLAFVPAPGGITYARSCPEGFKYGFNCGHTFMRGHSEYQDTQHLMQELRRMAVALMVAVDFEEHYLAACSGLEQLQVVRAYRQALRKAFDEAGL